jgi:putative endonuclease
MEWYVYMLRCNDNSLYTGITNNLNKRIKNHKSGKGAKYLRGRLPFQIVYKEICINRSQACKREIFIKKLNKNNKEILINKKLRRSKWQNQNLSS